MSKAKNTSKKAPSKTATKRAKPAAKKATATKKTAPKKAASAKKPAAAKKASTTPAAARKETEPAAAEKVEPTDEKTKELVLNARKRSSTPTIFKPRKSKNTPIVFTMEDVQEILDQRKEAAREEEAEAAKETTATKNKAAKNSKKAAPAKEEEPTTPRAHGAASIADILGFNPAQRKQQQTADRVPAKWRAYYESLLELRRHVRDELNIHTADTLGANSRESSGDLSGYGQHMADAGTDTFDRDFALSLVSNEQEALFEIEEAIQRIFDGSYGVCEITGETIDKDRLMAVPFTRYSLEGQRELEKTRRTRNHRGGNVFTDNDDDVSFGSDDDDN